MNLAIWINGNEKLVGELGRRVQPLEAEMDRFRKEVSRFHKKKVGCKEYWYVSGGRSGVWRYVGTARKNPAKELERKIERIRKEKDRLANSVNKAVIKPLGKHLLIDFDRFKPSDGEVISSLELYEALKELTK